MNRPSFTGDVEISADLYALLHASTTSAGASVDAVAEQLINAALDEVGAPWPIHPIVTHLAAAPASGLYRCTVCSVDGHQASVCMYASDAQRSPSSRAALDYISSDEPLRLVGPRYGLTKSAVGYAAEAITAARLTTLRAMTAAIAEGLGMRPAKKKRDRSGYNGYVIVDASVFEALERHCAKAGTSMRGTLDRAITAELDRLGAP